MQKLISELKRLYLLKHQQHHEQGEDGGSCFPAGELFPAILERHLRGEKTIAIDLVTDQGLTRALLIDFQGAASGKGAEHWSKLCEVANAVQEDLGLPAPAVSISGGKGYGLWLSLETPVPVARAQQFLHLLGEAYFPGNQLDAIVLRPDAGKPAGAATTLAELPPCVHQATGLWAAFINPGMGASFADEPGLEMAPPASAQVAFLDGLQSISVAQFTHALDLLQQKRGRAQQASAPALPAAGAPEGLLLKDATLEDIVRFLHDKNIEPTFRHIIAK